MNNQGRVVAIVQARMGARRLPNKMMLWLHGYPIIGWSRLRLLQSTLIDQVVYALPDKDKNSSLAVYLRSKNATLFFGSETDVLARFAYAASHCNASHVVRVCADNPCICPFEVDRLIRFYRQSSYDYAYNHIPRDNLYPDGLGAEIVSTKLIFDLHEKVTNPTEREHIFNHIWSNPASFRIGTFSPPAREIQKPNLRLDIDTAEDYNRFLKITIQPTDSTLKIVSGFLEC